MAITDDGLAVPAELLGLTTRHAVYRCYSAQGELLYVGTTGHLGRRLAAHAEKAWFLQVRGITLEWHPDEFEAGAAERMAIHVEHPKYNVVHRNARRPQTRGAGKKARRPQPRSARPVVPAAETEALILGYIADGHSASEAGRMAGKSDSYGRQVARLAKAAHTEPRGDARSAGDMA